MTTKEIDFNGTTVLVHETSDGFTAERKAPKDELVQNFADAHRCIERLKKSSGDRQDYVLYFDAKNNSHLAPGRGNLGTTRTDAARDHLRRNDLDLSIKWMEPKSGDDLWSIGIDVEDNR